MRRNRVFPIFDVRDIEPMPKTVAHYLTAVHTLLL